MITPTHKIDWTYVQQQLNENGFIHLSKILSPKTCNQLKNEYTQSSLYRSTINMKRYRFGEGEYKYFNYPLPPLIQSIREEWYEPLAITANQWMSWLSIATRFPQTHAELIQQCHSQEQLRPTPLILHYQQGGHNTLHQDLYGAIYFPFQIVFVLTQASIDHEGGELVLTEQVPRAQSKVEVITPQQGDAVIFTTHFRPIKGARGYYRATMKHGVSKIKRGERYALGIIFHDAQ
jgi:hypothetical protein